MRNLGHAFSRRAAGALLLAFTLLAAPGLPLFAADAKQRRFASPEEAMTALVDAIKADDRKVLLGILGPEGLTLVDSGDAVADRNARQQFAAEYARVHRLEAGGGKVVLHVGPDGYPFPVPLVPEGPVWRFDTRAGKEEILNRRIGGNELHAIQACLAYVDAQREYYSEDRNADGLREYAQRFASTRGKRDGLFWEAKGGEAPSPLGPLVAQARIEGYGGGRSATPVAYHGYYYRIITAQGANAPGGAYDYLAHGRMIGGFALVAFPAQYGVSGVMTFIVNHEGVVYQKDLGPNTTPIARGLRLFNPDGSWTKA
jgi:hypothetical protein